MKYLILLISLIICNVALAALHSDKQVFVIYGNAQGTTYQIKYYANSELIKKDEIDSLLNVIDLSMSLYKPESLISLFNSSTVRKVKLDEHMYQVVKSSFFFNSITKGYFDITTYPLLKLWGFGPAGFNSNPTNHEIDSVMNLVGMEKIKLKNRTLHKKNKYISIDLNGIAQGYSVDVLSDFLHKKKIDSYMVELGGEIYCKGLKEDGEHYKIEIQRPYHDNSHSYKIILKDMAITTSGSYEKYRFKDGVLISHHMNPFSGRPISNQTLSATVIAKTAMEADALDNYLMYLAPLDAISFVESIPDVEAYIIYSENNTLRELQTSRFNNYIYKSK